MKRSHQFVILILGFLSTAAWAGPRIAIVQILSGEAKLAGQPLTAPQMAEEGQLLAVSAKSEVRVQLLGSSKETVIKGPVNYTLAKATLSQEGKAVSRGTVAVKEEIGNLNRGAVAPQRTHKTMGLELEMPLVPSDNGWILRLKPRPNPASDAGPLSEEIFFTVLDLTDNRTFVGETPVDLPISELIINKSFQEGHRYEIKVQQNQGPQIERTFRVLSAEESAGLEEMAKVLRQEAIQSREISSLLRLAGLYKSFDQTEKVEPVLMQAVKNPAFPDLDESVQQKILANLNEARKSLDLPHYPLEPDTN